MSRVAAAMEDGDNLLRACLGTVNNQVGIDRKELHWLIGLISAPMARAGSSGKKSDLLTDDRFNPVGHLKAGIAHDVAPYLDKIESSVWRKNIANPHSDGAFSLAR
jgi:hypothetical protein